jgi:hypothetical protein
MGFLIWAAIVIAYFLVLPRYIDAGSAPGLLVAFAYGFVPLIVTSFAVAGTRANIPKGSPWRNTRATLSGALLTAIAGSLCVLALAFSDDEPSTSAAKEADKQFRWIEAGKKGVRSRLRDPASAEFRNVYFHRGPDGVPAACGEVNGANGFGGKSGFQRFVAVGESRVFLEEAIPQGDFSPLWNKLCSGP